MASKERATPLLEWYQRPLVATINEILAAEKTPLSDEDITMRLTDRGIPVSRAVVVGIRRRHGIPNRWIRLALREQANARA